MNHVEDRRGANKLDGLDRAAGSLNGQPKHLTVWAESPAVESREPGWLKEVREQAGAALKVHGLPTRKSERWRLTPLKDLFAEPIQEAQVASEVAVASSVPSEQSSWLHTVDGIPTTASVLLPGVRVLKLSEALQEDRLPPSSSFGFGTGDVLSSCFSHAARREHFAALNSARFVDAWVVLVEERAVLEKPLFVQHQIVSSRPTLAYPRLLVVAGASSQFSLVETLVQETSDASGLDSIANSVSEVFLGPGAHMTHISIKAPASQTDASNDDRVRVLSHISVRQERDSKYQNTALALGGRLNRLDLDVVLAGKGAECVLKGTMHAADGDHVACYCEVDHAASDCTSREEYRSVVDGNGHVVFNGTARVHRDAQRTEAHQDNRNLLRSDRAVVHTKPHLEIDADDVRCSHGATVGSMDDEQLFYLRSRGLPDDQARALLTQAFVHEQVEHIPFEDVRLWVADRMQKSMGLMTMTFEETS